MNHVIDYLAGDLNIEQFGTQYIAFSDVSASHIYNVFPSFSIKYVYEGKLYYRLDSGNYEVAKNNVLYAASQPGEVYFDDPRYSKAVGLCIGLDERLFLEALRIHGSEYLDADPEGRLNSFSDFPEFIEGLYQQENKNVSQQLYNTCLSIRDGQNLRSFVSEEWFFSLAEKIVKEEVTKFNACQKLKATRLATKKELLRRLSLAREYMDSNFLNNPLISEIASVAFLSDYHFFRSFKLAFGISPYQYLLNKRLEYAKQLVQSGKLPIHQIASIVGFSDQFSFSKAFKQKFKIAPSFLSKKSIAIEQIS